MTYELAKQLKDAGFPQKEVHESRCPCHEPWGMCGLEAHNNRPPYIPTLSELISELGDKFGNLERIPPPNKLFKQGFGVRSWDGQYYEIGESPEEALSRLWLTIQRRNASVETTS